MYDFPYNFHKTRSRVNITNFDKRIPANFPSLKTRIINKNQLRV